MKEFKLNAAATKKAIEGASLNRAFQSVNEIALEQARKSDKVSNDKMRS